MGILNFLRSKKVTIEIPISDGKTVKKKISDAEFEQLKLNLNLKLLDTVEAHILDSIRGYYVETWIVGDDIERETVEEYATSSGELYAMCVYEKGEPQTYVIAKEIWDKQKSIFSSIDQGKDYQEEFDEAVAIITKDQGKD